MASVIAVPVHISTASIWYRVQVLGGGVKHFEFTPNFAHDTSTLQTALFDGLVTFCTNNLGVTPGAGDIIVSGAPIKLA